MERSQFSASHPTARQRISVTAILPKRLSIRIALAASTLALGFILVIGGLSYFATRAKLIESYNLSLANEATLYAQHIGTTLSSIVTTLSGLTENALILNSLMDSLTRETSLVPFLRDFSRINDIPVTLWLTDFEGQIIAGNSRVPFSNKDWQRTVLEKGKPYAAIVTGADGDYLLAAKPIFYSRTLSPEGALVYTVALAAVQFPTHGDSRTSLQLSYRKPERAVLVQSNPISGQSDNRLKHTEMLPAPAVLAPLQLAVEASVDPAWLNEPLHELFLGYAVAGVLSFAIVLALSLAGASYLTRPLRELEAVARSVVASGSFEHRFTAHGVFEVERLGRVFNAMLERLNKAYQQLHQQTQAEVCRNRALSKANAALAKEISEYQRTEAALRESEERLRLVMEATNDGVWDWNLKTNETVLSNRYYTMLGYAPGEFKASYANWRNLAHPDDLIQVEATIQAHLRNQLPNYSMEYRLKNKAGGWQWVKGRGKVVERDAAGNPIRMVGTHVDITERKQAEEALYAEKERAQITLHSIGDAVITTDAQGRIDYLNPIAESLTGWMIDEAKGEPLVTVFHVIQEESRQPAPDSLVRCLQEGKVAGLGNHTVLISRSGQEYDIEDSAAPIRSREGEILGIVLVFRDVTETRRMARQIAHEATHDALTGLVNRREFEQRLEHALASAKKYGVRHALCYLDLDQFKVVNDTAGHAAGDELLKHIKGLLMGAFRERDTLARLGGDEFGLLLDNCPLEKAREIAETLVACIRDYRFIWKGHPFQVGVSIGLVPITTAAESAGQVLAQADVACYTAKERGRNRVHIYSESSQRHDELVRAARLRDALERERFRLYCQPIVPLSASASASVRYEILLRLLDEDGELLPPGAFIPAAERYGLMGAIDRWVIRTAFRQSAQKLREDAGVEIAINLSGNSLNDDTLLDFVQQQFSESAIPPNQVCFEITETAAIYNLSEATQFMAALKQCGSRLALDDFGSGLSSFKYLKNLPVDYLKIDGSFVRNMAEDAIDCSMVAAINQVGRIMGIKTVAEYVHSQAVLERLRALDVDYGQGYALGPPLSLESVTHF